MGFFRKQRELYKLTVGTTVFSYTDASADIEHDGITYTPKEIGRGKIAISNEVDQNNVTVMVKDDNEVAKYFNVGTPEEAVSISIYREIKNNRGNFSLLFSGRVITKEWKKGHKADLICESLIAQANIQALRRVYSKTCPYRLYDSETCRATKEIINRQALTVSGLDVFVDGAAIDDHYAGGTLTLVDGSARTIGSQDGNTLTLVSSLKVSQGDTVFLVKGCNHSINNCNDVHNNVLNFGGQPYTPDDNPFEGDLL